MKKNYFKIMPLVMVLCILFSLLAGCSRSNSQEKNENTTQTSGTQGNKAKADPVKFSILLRAGPTFTAENNPWIDEINEKANAKIEWIAVPMANIWEKRNVIMASNDYPEVIIMNTTSKGVSDNLYTSMVKNKIILPVDEYIKNAPNLMKYTHQAAWEAVRNADGKIYMVPRCTIVREDFMELRKDWRELLSLKVPETINDWSNYFKAVAKNDPDKNGKADTYGVSDTNELMSLSGTVNMEFFARAWNADKNWYDNGNGVVEYGVFAKDGRFKYVLDFYQKLMENKALDLDIMTNKGISSVVDKLGRGIVAAHRVFATQMSGINGDLRKLQPTAKFELVEFPTANESAKFSKEKLVFTNAGIYNAWAITDKAKGKEQQIIDVFDWMLSDEGWKVLTIGVEDVHYKKDGNNVTYIEPAYSELKAGLGSVQLFRRPNDEDLWLVKPSDEEVSKFGAEITEEYQYKKQWLAKSVDYVNKNYVQKGLMGISSQKELDFYKNDVYTKKFTEVMAKIIYGELPVTAWDGFIKDVYASGWEEVTKEYNDYYKSHK